MFPKRRPLRQFPRDIVCADTWWDIVAAMRSVQELEMKFGQFEIIRWHQEVSIPSKHQRRDGEDRARRQAGNG